MVSKCILLVFVNKIDNLFLKVWIWMWIFNLDFIFFRLVFYFDFKKKINIINYIYSEVELKLFWVVRKLYCIKYVNYKIV